MDTCGDCGAPHDTICEADDCGRSYHGACDPDNHADHPYYPIDGYDGQY